MDYLMAFVIGGLLCFVAQLIVDLTNFTQAHTMVLFVSLGALISGFGLYQPLVDLGGAGATVPLPGFGHALVQGITKATQQEGAVGLVTGGLTATALGVTVAVVFGYAFSILFDPKG